MKRTGRKLLDKELWSPVRFNGKSYRADRARVTVNVNRLGGTNVHVSIANVSIWSEANVAIELPVIKGRVVVPDVVTGGTSASVQVVMYLYTEYGKPDPPERDRY